jgi:feruloyl-CoA synthase
VLAHPRTRDAFQSGLTDLAREATGSSTVITRAILLVDPPSIDALELTDKGTISQRAVLNHRAAVVEALYANPPAAEVIVIPR